MDIWASCETHNSSFFYFCAIFPLEAPSVPTADPSQAWNKNKHWIKWGAKVLELQRKEECCSLLFEFGLVGSVCLFFWLLCPQLFCNFYVYMGMDWMCVRVCMCTCQCFHFHCVFNGCILVRILFTTIFFFTVGFHLNLRQKNIQYIIWYRTSESIRSRTCSRISNWMCVPTKSTWQMAWVRVFFSSRWRFFTTIKLEATFYFAHCCCGCWCSWYYLSMGLFFLILFACANIERERARAQAQ